MLWLSQLISCVCQNGFILLLNLFCQNSVMIAVDQWKIPITLKNKIKKSATPSEGHLRHSPLNQWLKRGEQNNQIQASDRTRYIPEARRPKHFVARKITGTTRKEKKRKKTGDTKRRHYVLVELTLTTAYIHQGCSCTGWCFVRLLAA